MFWVLGTDDVDVSLSFDTLYHMQNLSTTRSDPDSYPITTSITMKGNPIEIGLGSYPAIEFSMIGI